MNPHLLAIYEDRNPYYHLEFVVNCLQILSNLVGKYEDLIEDHKKEFKALIKEYFNQIICKRLRKEVESILYSREIPAIFYEGTFNAVMIKN
jgi:hypothetical protein